MKYFQRALVGFNNLWICFIFREFNWMSMSKIPSPPLPMESWDWCLWGIAFFFRSRKIVYYFFDVLFDIFWNKIYLTYVAQFGQENLVYDYLFTSPLKESLSLFQIWIFYYTFAYFALIGVIDDKVAEINVKYFNEKLQPSHFSWLINLFLYALAHKTRLLKIYLQR